MPDMRLSWPYIRYIHIYTYIYIYIHIYYDTRGFKSNFCSKKFEQNPSSKCVHVFKNLFWTCSKKSRYIWIFSPTGEPVLKCSWTVQEHVQKIDRNWTKFGEMHLNNFWTKLEQNLNNWIWTEFEHDLNSPWSCSWMTWSLRTKSAHPNFKFYNKT